jgi:hypothetical protein
MSAFVGRPMTGRRPRKTARPRPPEDATSRRRGNGRCTILQTSRAVLAVDWRRRPQPDVWRAAALAAEHPQARADACVGGPSPSPPPRPPPPPHTTTLTSATVDPATVTATLTSHLRRQVLSVREEARPLPLGPMQQPGPQPPGTVRFVCVSDTHSAAPRQPLPAGDCLIHAGDFTDTGRPQELEAFCAWLRAQPHARKIVVAGNHDLTLDPDSCEPQRA